MVAALIGGVIGAAAIGAFARATLRQSARNGRILSPFQQLIAGDTSSMGATGGSGTGDMPGNWVVGGFQQKMDKNEASAILGLKCACSLSFQSDDQL